MAWHLFGDKNGCSDLPSFRSTILAHRGQADSPGVDPVIGCIVLAIPFFFPQKMWIAAPRDWHPNIVQGKSYLTGSGIGKEIWTAVLERLSGITRYQELEPEIRRKGPLYVVEGRLGQAAFRTSVLDAYHRRCAVTLERTMPALETSHIKPYKESGPNSISNGLLLRADLHQIFDEGYITLTPDHKIEVSRKIKEEFENGREYTRFNGKKIENLPSDRRHCPLPAYLEWHNQRIYRG